MNVTPIGAAGVTPEVVAAHIVKDAPEMAQIYVVAIGKNSEVWEYISGDVKGMCFAGAIMTEHGLKAADRAGLK
jgi:hypothetical protein